MTDLKCYRCAAWPCVCKDGITLIHGDCREVLPLIPVVDLCLTDPPYGLAGLWAGGGGGQKSSWRFHPSEAQSWDGQTFNDISSVTRAGREVVIWGGHYYTLPPTRGLLIWDKKQPDTWTTGQAEVAWTNLNRTTRVYRMAQCEAHTEMGDKQHPTQKPLSLIRWCFKWSQTTGHVIDPFAGSGTTLVAAKQLGRKAIGIEIEERYCQIAANRLRQEVLQFEE